MTYYTSLCCQNYPGRIINAVLDILSCSFVSLLHFLIRLLQNFPEDSLLFHFKPKEIGIAAQFFGVTIGVRKGMLLSASQCFLNAALTLRSVDIFLIS